MLLAALLVAGIAAGACTSEDPPSGSAESSMVGFVTRGGDAFSWTKTVVGEGDCEVVTLEVNGEPLEEPVQMRGSRFRARVPIRSGPNQVVARCDTADGAIDVSDPLVFQGRLESRPTARISVSTSGEVITFDGRRSEPTRPDGAKVARYSWRPDARHPSKLTTPGGRPFDRVEGPRLQLEVPAEDGEYYVSLEVSDAAGRSDTSTTYFEVRDGTARAVDMLQEHPSWIDRAVIYAPIAQLWGNGGPETVERRLPYLKELGVDALWLWPPATLRAIGEEYAITDYFELDPSWGPMSAFKSLVDEAHRLGFHVLLDFVPNHMSDQSPYFKDAQEHGEASNYWDYFDRDDRGRHTHYFDWTNLPNLNFDNPEVRTMVLEAFSYWVRDLGIDGFRVDVAWGIKRRRPGFWLEWREEMKRIDPDLMLIAEASAVDPYYFDNGFDIAYDWTEHPGQWAWVSAFEFPEEAGALLEPAILNGDKGYSEDAIVMRFLNNNDTGARFVDRYGTDMTRIAAILQFTLPGVPAMFAGDEIGASYEPYSNLTPIVWRDRYGLRNHYERLIDLKHSVESLSSRRLHMIDTEPNGALAYVRPAVGVDPPVVVILNFGSKGRVRLARSQALDDALAASGGDMTDLMTDRPVDLRVRDGGVSLQMDAQSGFVLVPEAA